jgi:hypothetical protein
MFPKRGSNGMDVPLDSAIEINENTRRPEVLLDARFRDGGTRAFQKQRQQGGCLGLENGYTVRSP